MKIAVLDDFAICRDDVHKCLHRYFQENYAGETPVIDDFECGEDFLASFTPASYDMIFIDQYMTGITGMDTARKIREKDRLTALVFVTVSRDHAIESYEVRASGYLVKPYEYSDFEKMMALAEIEKIRAGRFIRVAQENILLREILWCDRDAHYVQIHTDRSGLLRFRLPSGELTRMLAPYPQFLTCYKGCVINMDRVDYMDNLDFVMDTGERIPFPKRNRTKIEMTYHTYLFQHEREKILL